MFGQYSATRGLTAAALVIASMSATACKKNPTEPSNEPQVASLRVSIGSQTITVSETGTVTGGPIVVARNSTTPFTVTFLKADGSVETSVTSSTFRLDVTSDNTATASFTRTGAFSGNLAAGATAGTTIMRFALFHLEEQHNDFGPLPIAVTVQ